MCLARRTAAACPFSEHRPQRAGRCEFTPHRLAGAPGRQLVRRHKEEVEALLAAHLAELDGLPAVRVADLAEQLSFLLEGAMARAGLEGDSRRLHRVRELALQLVDTAVGTTE